MKKVEIDFENIKMFCEKNNRIPNNSELSEMDVTNLKTLRKFTNSLYNCNYIDYFRSLGYPYGKNEVKYDNKYIAIKHLTLQELRVLIKQFIDKYGYFPKYYEFNKKYNLPSYTSANEILKLSNLTFDDIASEFNVHRYTNNEGYEYWINKYKECMENDKPIEYRDFKRFDLPTASWFIINCKNAKVKTYLDWIRYELKLIPHQGLTKEECSKLLKIMQNQLDRPLMYEDLAKAHNTQQSVCLASVLKHWRTTNDMKMELGFEIIQEDMTCRHKTKDEMLEDLQKLIDELDRIPSTKDIESCQYINNPRCYWTYFGGINNALIQLGYIPNKKCISLHMTNEDIINIYKEFIEDNQIVPSYEYACKIYELPAPMTVLRRFNCLWNDFITMLGYKPNSCRYNQTIAKDGTLCNSISESVIHNYLLTKNIKNLNKETLYRDILDNDILQNKAGFKRLDWTFNYEEQTYYVEYFGMMGFNSYDERHNTKIKLMTEDGKLDNFIAIYPKDLNKLDNIFSFIK